MNRRQKLIILLATGFYSGKIPMAPGTFGSGVGLFVCYLLSFLGPMELMGGLAVLVGFSMWIAGRAEVILNQKDPGSIVIDEIAGMAFALAWIPFSFQNALTGFIVFRVLDIIKPFPIRNLEKRFSGGIGIVIDDVAAGIFTNLIVRIFRSIVA